MLEKNSLPRTAVPLLVLALVAVLAAGCGSSNSAEVSGGSVAGKRVMLLGCSSANPWCNGYNKTMTSTLEKAGAKVTTLTNNFDVTVQAQQMAQAIAQKPDLILLFPADARGVVPSLHKAKRADVPVIVFDSPLHAEHRSLVEAELLPNHPQLGKFAAMNLQEGLKKAGVKSGDVIAITGTAGEIITRLRMNAFKKQLASTPEYKLVEVQDGNWDPVKTGQIAQQLFAKYGRKIVGAYGMADYMAAAISRAAQQAGIQLYPKTPGGVVVTGSNCAGVGVKAIKAGLMYGGATQSPILEATDHSVFVLKVLRGQQIKTVITTPVDRVTRANVDKYVKYCSF